MVHSTVAAALAWLAVGFALLPGALALCAPPRHARSASTRCQVVVQSNDNVLDGTVCLMPGEAMVRVDVAPNNARRIYIGVDVAAEIDEVWALLTDYAGLAEIVPNLVENEVLSRTNGGARLRQVGSASVLPGLNFRASMILDVRELPQGMSARSIRGGEVSDANEQQMRALERDAPLKRGVFPRPWFTSPGSDYRDISMQSDADAPGDFTLYQGLWRASPLPICAPDGGSATRLTYAVEIQPRPWLPVALVEARIADDLVKNLEAVAAEASKRERSKGGRRRRAEAVAAAEAAVDDAEVAASEAREVEAAAVAARALAAARVAVFALEGEPLVGASLAAATAAREAATNLAQLYRGDAGLDATRCAGEWSLLFSSALTQATTPAPPAGDAKRSLPGSGDEQAVRARRPLSELSIPRALVRQFPRLSNSLGRFVLQSVEVEVRCDADGGATFDTILKPREVRAALIPAPALRLQHTVVAPPKMPFGVTIVNERVRIEPAYDRDGRNKILPRPAFPTAWLPPGSRRRTTSFDVLYADDDLLVTKSDDNDLRVLRRRTP